MTLIIIINEIWFISNHDDNQEFKKLLDSCTLNKFFEFW